MNQTIEHLASHDETTDLNVSFIEALKWTESNFTLQLIDETNNREKFNDVLLSNQTLNSPNSTTQNHHPNQYHPSVIHETGGSVLNIGHPGIHFEKHVIGDFNLAFYFRPSPDRTTPSQFNATIQHWLAFWLTSGTSQLN